MICFCPNIVLKRAIEFILQFQFNTFGETFSKVLRLDTKVLPSLNSKPLLGHYWLKAVRQCSLNNVQNAMIEIPLSKWNSTNWCLVLVEIKYHNTLFPLYILYQSWASLHSNFFSTQKTGLASSCWLKLSHWFVQLVELVDIFTRQWG